MNMQDASWSTVSLPFTRCARHGQQDPPPTAKDGPEALRTYYNRFYSTHTDSDPPCPWNARWCICLISRRGESHLKAAAKDGFIYGAQTTLPSADQVETMLVSPICTVTADYTEGDGCLLGERTVRTAIT